MMRSQLTIALFVFLSAIVGPLQSAKAEELEARVKSQPKLGPNAAHRQEAKHHLMRPLQTVPTKKFGYVYRLYN